MAEFQEVLRQWRRMCQCHNCKECPGRTIGDKDIICILTKTENMRTEAEVEEIITAWAVDHPEPVYPTWSEWLLDVGGGKKRRFESRGYAGNTEVVSHDYYVCALDTPIPSDLAHKLGLQPKHE